MNKVLFLAAFFFAYTVQTISGFAGNVFAMPAGTALLGMQNSVAILNASGFFACGLLTVLNIKDVNWRELGKIFVTMLPFVLLGIWLDTVLSLTVLLRVYGIAIIGIGLRNLLQKERKILPEWTMWMVLCLAGLMQGMFVSGGGFLVIYALQKLPKKAEFRITLSATWTGFNLLYGLIAFSQGSYTTEVWGVIAFCLPLAVVATWLGNKLQKRLSQSTFLKITNVMLLIVGAVLLITA